MVAAPLSRTVFRVPQLTRVGLLGLWDEEAAFDGFLAAHPIAARFASDWQARLAPVRAVTTADRERPFHNQSAFVRFRPIRLSGRLNGANPLAEGYIATK